MAILQSMTEAVQKKNEQVPSMAANVAANLDSNSLLMKNAAAKGNRFAAARGLQNSTVGAEAAQRAMLDAATPIAQVDTQNQFTAQQAGLDREHQRGMTQLQADLNYSNQNRLNQAQNQFAAQQAELDRNQQTNLTRLQADLNYNNQSRLADLQHRNEIDQLNAQVAANTIGKSIDFAQQITNNFDAQIAGILQNTNMKEEDKQRAINQLKGSRDSELRFMSTFFQHIPTTQRNWSFFPNLGVPSINIG
ncbi:hypothetical protein QV08_01325 [Gallibacterium salpingitidis]|uniref:Uncharacterized protein n=1 Tax=Gallibacterium salpingitidis TaxID=505341 RepID=A0AB36E6A1_9PAST|nr:hypothetical protein [Gallibacterium salpingitidis]OBX09604.1 hypothetical protein QV08_01325 [Gallibacterium salpingitidis]OBX10459.1 hypothetical protein QV09_05880 [Gallibacterium salpingitidis]